MKKSFCLLSLCFILFSCQTKTEQEAVVIEHYVSAEMEAMGLPFSDAVRVGNMLYLSGQVGNLPGQMTLVEGGLKAEARQIMKNIQKVLKANGSSLEHAVKFSVFIDDIALWGEFNEVYTEFFPGKKPARSAFGVEGLALGAAVEVECIAYIPN